MPINLTDPSQSFRLFEGRPGREARESCPPANLHAQGLSHNVKLEGDRGDTPVAPVNRVQMRDCARNGAILRMGTPQTPNGGDLGKTTIFIHLNRSLGN